MVTRQLGTRPGQKPELDLHREFKLTPHVSLPKGRLMQVRVFDGQARLSGDTDEQIQVVLRELLPQVPRGDLDDPRVSLLAPMSGAEISDLIRSPSMLSLAEKRLSSGAFALRIAWPLSIA